MWSPVFTDKALCLLQTGTNYDNHTTPGIFNHNPTSTLNLIGLVDISTSVTTSYCALQVAWQWLPTFDFELTNERSIGMITWFFSSLIGQSLIWMIRPTVKWPAKHSRLQGLGTIKVESHQDKVAILLSSTLSSGLVVIQASKVGLFAVSGAPYGTSGPS